MIFTSYISALGMLTFQLVLQSKPVGPKISMIFLLRRLNGLSAIFFCIKNKKDAATIPNAVCKGNSKSIPKKVLAV